MSVRAGSIAFANLAWLAREVWASHPGHAPISGPVPHPRWGLDQSRS
jgi:hypothetical protein